MSIAAAQGSKRVRQSCQSCRDRKAKFKYRGQVRADRDHTLCFECYRSEANRQRALRLASLPAFLRPAALGADRPEPSPAQVAHRFRMLAHLRTTATAR